MEHYQKANKEFVDEDYQAAIENFSLALKEMPRHAESYLNRGTARLKLKKLYEALEDMNFALGLEPQLEIALYRQGIVYFELEEYESAKKSFETASKLQKDPSSQRSVDIKRYIRKCDAELVDGSDTVIEPPTAPKPLTPAPAVSAPAPAPTRPSSIVPINPVQYQYYQSAASLNISVLAKNLTSDEIDITIQPNHLKVVVTVGGILQVVIDKKLFAEVDADKSNFKVYKSKVEITLIKVAQEIWPGLEYSGRPQPAPASTSSSSSSSTGGPSATEDLAASSRPKAYASSKDWDKVGSAINQELEEDKPQGEEALNTLFQQIYKDADPETKMAMKKSFQTSGGTVLSTNWGEVSKKNYEEERQAPKGMEWRQWDGKKLDQVEDDDPK
jgi:tetratricopeptide (TPR) repeat protein